MNKSGVSGKAKRGKTNERKRLSEGFLDGIICARKEVIVGGIFAGLDSFPLLYLRVLFVHNCRRRS